MKELSPNKQIVMQTRGMSASHPIILFWKNDRVIICSVASREGNSSFDYSLIMPKDKIRKKCTDEEIIEDLWQTNSYINSEWGFNLALDNGITRGDIESVASLIDIKNPKLIRLSKATKLNNRG